MEVARQEEVWKCAPGQLRPACTSGNGTFKRKREKKKETVLWQVYRATIQMCRRILRKPVRTCIWHFKILITNLGYIYNLFRFVQLRCVWFTLPNYFFKCLCSVRMSDYKIVSIRRITSSSEVNSGLYYIQVLENYGQSRNLSAYSIHSNSFMLSALLRNSRNFHIILCNISTTCCTQ